MEFKRGNTYSLKVKFLVNNQELDYDTVDKIEFIFGEVKKEIDNSNISLNDDNQLLLYLTQEETFKMNDTIDYQARIKYKNGDVISTDINTANIKDCLFDRII